MSFMINREKKLRKSNIQDGSYLAEIIEIKQGKSDCNIWHVEFKLLAEGETISNRYVDNPEVYGAFDALIDAALGIDSCNVDLSELVGHYVKVIIANEGRYTNVKRVYKVNRQDMEEIERYQEDHLEEDDSDNELDDDELDDDELEIEDDLEDDSDPEDEQPRRNRLSSNLGRRRRNEF
ncbi:hypothetical protein [Paenibacillus sp. Marseille-Q4541]|uniref:hypothetical protein n=1 Tax=Paenibacillus sp. Marseille-Q4541 TaxID=2831522 RepID=UPI001BA55F87|nr:hypothetical protein [Paenibacillus sp. Marseille-Q4541]